MHIITALKAAIEASISIMQVYKGDFSAQYKYDGSPVTIADKQADAIIRQHLQPTCIPVISEESDLLPYESRRNWSKLWLVDPLDGTREFIKRNGEFTVNIALVENGKPIMGIITAPASGKAWVGIVGHGISFVDNIYNECMIADPENYFDKLKVPVASPTDSPRDMIRFAVSRSHPDDQTERLIRHLRNQEIRISRVPRGSSLKLCDIAMGQADVYPRFGPTKEWDIAAGHAILMAAGGDVVDMQNGAPLTYNKPDMLNPYFLASKEKHTKELLAIIRQWHTNPRV